MLKQIRRQRGFTLVELLLGMVIGAFILMTLLQLVTGNKIVSRMQEGLGRLQENARFADIMVGYQVRMAGYRWVDPFLYPDNSYVENAFPSDNSLTTPVNIAFSRPGQVLFGTDNNDDNSDQVLDGTDTLTVRYRGADDGSTRNCLGQNLAPNELTVDTLYLEAGAVPPVLRCSSTGAGGTQDQPLVEGVETMQVLYGMDADNQVSNPIADCYLDASAVAAGLVTDCSSGLSFSQVVGVRVGFLHHSPGQDGANIDLGNSSGIYRVIGTDIDASAANDRRLRVVFDSTYGIRNNLK
jgi:type IV pilus assembly protein PilW